MTSWVRETVLLSSRSFVSIKRPRKSLKMYFLRVSSQKIGSSLVSILMAFEIPQSELFTFKVHWLDWKIPEFNLFIYEELYSQLKDHSHKNGSFWTYCLYSIKAIKSGGEYKLCCHQFLAFIPMSPTSPRPTNWTSWEPMRR